VLIAQERFEEAETQNRLTRRAVKQAHAIAANVDQAAAASPRTNVQCGSPGQATDRRTRVFCP
jgi:hypothetical protein